MSKKISITYVRSKDTMNAYLKRIDDINKGLIDPMEQIFKNHIKEFKYWVIVENEFPYDAIATVSHMIFPKRSIEFDWSCLSEGEKNELEALKDGYIRESYEVVWENLPNSQSMPGRFHLHLLRLKRSES